MSKTSFGIVVFLVGLVGAGWFGQRARQAHDASQLADRARLLLEESITKAPSLADLRSTEARKLCAESLVLADDPRTRALQRAAHAVELFARADHARAASELGLARAALGDTPLLQALDASLADALGEHERARAQSARSLARGSQGANDPRLLLLAADFAREDGRSDDALALLERALKLQPKAAVLYERRGLVQELLANLPAARRDFETAARVDRNTVAPLLHLGRMLHDAADPRGAIFAFRSALQRDPRNIDARIGTGVCRNEIGDRVGARMELEEAEANDPTRIEPQLALGDLDIADGKLQDALLHYRRAVQLDKTSAAGWVKLGNSLVRVQAADQAVLAFQTAIKLAPDLAQAHNGLGAALLATGDARGAETELGAAAILDPRDPNPLLNLAMLRKRSGDEQGAQLALAQARERDPRQRELGFTDSDDRRASRARRP